MDEKKLQQLRHLCELHVGRCPIYVSLVSDNNMHVVIQTQAKVRPDTEFCRKLEALLGQAQYKLLRPHDSLTQASVGV